MNEDCKKRFDEPMPNVVKGQWVNNCTVYDLNLTPALLLLVDKRLEFIERWNKIYGNNK